MLPLQGIIENINAKGTRRNIGTGFFIAPGKLLTAFQVIDGAANVRIVGPQGRIEATEVLAFNRRQDWILLKVSLEKCRHSTRSGEQRRNWRSKFLSRRSRRR